MRSNINERLPVEIIRMILSYLNSIEVAKKMRVCKLWNHIGQNNKDLWKDASYLTSDYNQIPFRIENERIEKLRARSGGTLNNLNLIISTMNDYKEQADLLKELPAMNVQNLRLLTKSPGKAAVRQEKNGTRITILWSAIRTALAGCTKLKSLNMVNHGRSLACRSANGSDSEFDQLCECKLEAFTARGADAMKIFGEGTLVRLLSHVRSFKMSLTYMSENEAIRLMNAVKATLEEGRFHVREEREPLNDIETQIVLPNLVKFHLEVSNYYYMRGNGRSTIYNFKNVSFQWPRLKELTLEGEARLDFYERIIPLSIESLRLRRIQGLPLSQLIGILENLTKLKKLAVEFLEEDTDDFLQQILLKVTHIPIEDLEIVGAYGLRAKVIKDFVTQRKEHPHSTPLKRLYLSLPSTSRKRRKKLLDPKTRLWLNKEVEIFRCEVIIPE